MLPSGIIDAIRGDNRDHLGFKVDDQRYFEQRAIDNNAIRGDNRNQGQKSFYVGNDILHAGWLRSISMIYM
jgi:hypothetical protein